MTDDNITRFPRTPPDDTETQTDERRAEGDDRVGPDTRSYDENADPILREGPDAPDAADIEDPSEQL
ncbi:MAG TPA: hypothetical protein VFN41_11425 [Candidatus Limnocylindrales bacterium]|nr:hypothetical protein [Candidatus Limnocylindrales bacterium]